MTLHTEILSESQRTILPGLGSFASAQGFYLAGGTTVALYLGHRQSVDFDWFSRGTIDDPLALAERARRGGLAMENVQVAPGTLHSLIDGVRVSFFEHPYVEISDSTKWSDFSIELASLDDLSCMKLAAIAQRGSRKDFIDLYTIVFEYKPLRDLLQLYRRKYSIDDIGHVLVGLTYFDDAEEEPSPVMLRDISWDEIKREFQRWTKDLTR